MLASVAPRWLQCSVYRACHSLEKLFSGVYEQHYKSCLSFDIRTTQIRFQNAFDGWKAVDLREVSFVNCPLKLGKLLFSSKNIPRHLKSLRPQIEELSSSYLCCEVQELDKIRKDWYCDWCMWLVRKIRHTSHRTLFLGPALPFIEWVWGSCMGWLDHRGHDKMPRKPDIRTSPGYAYRYPARRTGWLSEISASSFRSDCSTVRLLSSLDDKAVPPCKYVPYTYK